MSQFMRNRLWNVRAAGLVKETFDMVYECLYVTGYPWYIGSMVNQTVMLIYKPVWTTFDVTNNFIVLCQ